MAICEIKGALPILGRFGIGVELGSPLDPKIFNTAYAEYPLGKQPDFLTGGKIAKVISSDQVVKLDVDGEYSYSAKTAVFLTRWDINKDREGVSSKLCWVPEAYKEVTLSEYLRESFARLANNLQDIAWFIRHPSRMLRFSDIAREYTKAELSSCGYGDSPSVERAENSLRATAQRMGL
ncbi:hypothetical protein M1437_03885 [Patescibacteria group bacterium]|nr:hypothetical protein [Patescibacteria group bacterium]